MESVKDKGEIIATGLFGETMRADGEPVATTEAARIVELRAALASIAGGTPARELEEDDAIDRLALVQDAAERALQEDEEAAKESER